MKILGIESSCDETAAAVIEDGTRILSSVVASSLEMHSKTGGIIPEVAAREQIKCIIPVMEEALRDTQNVTRNTKDAKRDAFPVSRITYPEIDAIAVTVGPGLVGSLLVGIETAKTLAYLWDKPIVPVNHMVGHLYANWINSQIPNSKFQIPNFPAVSLVVSGGHTDLVLMKDHGKIEFLGGTRDDAAGECFDKSARLLGLPYPGGPAIAAAAQQFNPSTSLRASNSQMKLPRPMINDDNFDFSFSGLKTAVLREVSSSFAKASEDKERSNAIAYELQEAITDVLVTKTIRAAEKYKVKSILLAGGVSANSRLREKFSTNSLITNYQFLVPQPKLCTDNAAYIASCAFFNYKPVPWQKIKVNPGLTISDKI